MGFSLKKIAKGIAGVALPAIGTAIGGPVGGAIGSSIAGGLVGSSGAKRAGAASAAGMQQGVNTLQAATGQARTDYQPYQQAGTNALAALANPAASFESSPGYQFARDQGLDAVKTQQNALGRLASGNTLAALTQYGTGLAQQDYNNWWNQQSGLAGMGLNATGNLNSLASGNAGSIANLQAGIGSAQAGGIQGAADAWGNVLSDVGGFLGMGNPLQRQGGNGGGILPDALGALKIAPNAVKQVPRNLLSYGG